MKIAFHLLITFLTPFFMCVSNLCDKLPNGKYKVIFDKDFSHYKNYEVQIADSLYTKYNDGQESEKGKIKWGYECSFVLDSGVKADTTSMTEFAKLLSKSFGPDLILLKESRGDTIYFQTTHSYQLLVTVNSGKFIRIK